MADQEQLALLKEGTHAWNEWRSLNSVALVDLTYADLSRANLCGANLADTDLSGANLARANLAGANLPRADLSVGADLADTDLSGANLAGANLAVAHLLRADLASADLSGANLASANLAGANLTRAILSSANLASANLTRAILSGAHLSFADLSGVNLSDTVLLRADLSGANLAGANLSGMSLSGMSLLHADLSGANLSGANLFGANLSVANLSGANLSRAELSGANLSVANLSRANLADATLSMANLTLANLTDADLTGAGLSYTVLGSVDLSKTLGLETVVHDGPSVIDHRTLLQSGPLPPSFLRGCGVPDRLIDYLPTLLNAERIHFYSCFISYSTANQGFADQLYADLQAKGVRCWFAPHDIQGGKKIHEQIDEAIRVFDRLLLILSPESMASEWVATEIAKARRKEAAQNRRVLFPISIVPYSSLRDWELFDADRGKDSAREIREYFIPDFSVWKDHDAYTKAFDGLLNALKSEN